MSYQVTARKWRPQVADDVIGQSHVTQTLRNAIASNRISHAYIFSGPRGVGKTTTARILAKAINCLHPAKNADPDNTCDICREITEGRSVNVFEIDGASNRGVDEIRNLRESVRYAPARGKYKVYIIDEVHMLTKEAFNALLKTLEEPPPHVIFIFATTEIHKVPATILSRCQRFDFRRISVPEITGRLRHIAREEKIAIDDDALLLIAKRADGAMRDAQSIFDQIVSFCGDTITAAQIIQVLNLVDEEVFFRAAGIIAAKDSKAGLLLIDDLMNRGVDGREFVQGLIEHFRNLLLTRTTGSTDLLDASEQSRQHYRDQAKEFTETDLLRLIKIAAETDAALRWSQQPRYKLEVGLLCMIKLESAVEITQLLNELEELKKKISLRPAEEKLNGGGGSGRYTGSSPAAMPPPSSAPSHAAPSLQQSAPVKGAVKASVPKLRPDQVVVPQSAMLAAAGGAISPAKRETAPGSRPLPRAGTAAAPPAAAQGAYDEDASTPPPSSAGGGTPSPESVPVSISKEEALRKWNQIITEVSRQRIHVGTILSATAILDVKDNSLHIGCPDGFHLDTLKRNKQFLLDLMQGIYGAKVRLEAVIASVRQTSSAGGALPAGSLRQPEETGATAQASRISLAPDATPAGDGDGGGGGGGRHPVIQALIREFDAKEIDF